MAPLGKGGGGAAMWCLNGDRGWHGVMHGGQKVVGVVVVGGIRTHVTGPCSRWGPEGQAQREAYQLNIPTEYTTKVGTWKGMCGSQEE